MPATPIDQRLADLIEALQDTVRGSIHDGVVTPLEAGMIAGAFVETLEITSEVGGTLRSIRTIAAAGASSDWSQRKVREHRQDMMSLHSS